LAVGLALGLGLGFGLSPAAPAEVLEAGPIYALLVGVGDYPAFAPDRAALGSAQDLAAVAAAVRARGAPAGHITALLDAQASKSGVLDAISRLGAAAPPGSHLLLHFSGHGARRPDLDRDEEDGLDEVLLTYGADPDTGLSDDELGLALEGLRQRVGPQGSVTVSVDACFGAAVLRGPADAAPRGRGPSGRGPDIDGRDGGEGRAGSGRGGLAPLVVLSAARPDEGAHERPVEGGAGLQIGVFSGALAEALAGPARSWGEVHQRLLLSAGAAARGQHPVAAGALSAGVFGGPRAAGAAPFIVEGADSAGRLRLSAGALLGLQPGATVALRNADGRSSALVEVVQAELGVAFLAPPAGAPAEAWLGAGAWLRSGPPVALPVRLAGEAGPAREAWAAALLQRPDLRVDERSALQISILGDEARLSYAGAALATGPAADPLRGAVGAALLQRAAAAQVMDRAAPQAPGLGLAVFTVRPGAAGDAVDGAGGAGACGGALPADAAPTSADQLRVGEVARVAVHAALPEPLHLTLLHQDGAGEVRVLWPLPGAVSEPLRLDGWWSPPVCWPVRAPLGDERLRAVLSPLPLDLRPLLQAGARSARPAVEGGVVDVAFEVLPPIPPPPRRAEAARGRRP
jgi:hypothetical protein